MMKERALLSAIDLIVGLLACVAISWNAKAKAVDQNVLMQNKGVCFLRAEDAVSIINRANPYLKDTVIKKVLAIRVARNFAAPHCQVAILTSNNQMLLYEFSLNGQLIEGIDISECYEFKDICKEAKQVAEGKVILPKWGE